MSLFINEKNEYPRYIGDLLLINPEWEEGDDLPDGWKLVNESEVPEFGEGQTIEEDFPVEVDGEFYRNLKVRDLTDEELARINAPSTAKEKLVSLGFTEAEIRAIAAGVIR